MHWRLLTTHPVAGTAAAWQIVEWYKKRWLIEQLFRVLKSQGLRIEDSQIDSADLLIKLIAIATKAAAITIQLLQAREGRADLPASATFDPSQIDAWPPSTPDISNNHRARKTHIPMLRWPGPAGLSPVWEDGMDIPLQNHQGP